MRQEDGVIPPIVLRPTEGDPLYVQLFEGLKDAIISRRIAGGTRLPSTRALARDMNVSRTTTVQAYRQLEREGYVLSEVGSGTYVAQELPEETLSAAAPETSGNGASETNGHGLERALSARSLSTRGYRLVYPRSDSLQARGLLPFSPGVPALDEFPYEVWRRIERDVRIPRRELGPADPGGHILLRSAIARHLSATRAIQCHPDQVVVTTGVRDAFTILTVLLLDPGDGVLMEEPGYATVARILEKLGAVVVAVPVDDGGMDVAEGIALRPDARLAYLTPSNQFPLGTLLTMARRRRLVEWARASGSWIVEDDYDCEYRFRGPPNPAIRSLDGADVCVVYVNTFSRILFPALSLGFVVLPDTLVEPFKTARSHRMRPPPIPPQLTLARFMEEGHLLRHIRRMRRVYETRGNALQVELGRALPEHLEVLTPMAGAHLVAWLPEGMDDRKVAARAALNGVVAPPLSRFRKSASGRGGLVLGFGGSGVDQLQRAVKKLRRAFG